MLIIVLIIVFFLCAKYQYFVCNLDITPSDTCFIVTMSTATSTAGNMSRALKCRHFCSPWDLHNYCPTCREAFKGDDNCVTGKGKCMVCASFTEEQRQQIAKRKRYVKKDKAVVSDLSKDESELLGEPDRGVIFLKVLTKSSNRQLVAFTSHHPNPAMLYWEIPEPRCSDWIIYL